MLDGGYIGGFHRVLDAQRHPPEKGVHHRPRLHALFETQEGVLLEFRQLNRLPPRQGMIRRRHQECHA